VAVIDEEEEKERARREVKGKRRWRSGQWVESWSTVYMLQLQRTHAGAGGDW
jgi:hypothetical protein